MTIHGKVQGVGFHFGSQRGNSCCRQLPPAPDGACEAIVQGENPAQAVCRRLQTWPAEASERIERESSPSTRARDSTSNVSSLFHKAEKHDAKQVVRSKMAEWNFLTNHANVLLCVTEEPDIRLRPGRQLASVTR
jgi:acylphosphatase